MACETASSHPRSTTARRELDALIQKSAGLAIGPYLRRLVRASVAAAALSACSMSHGGGDDAGGGRDAGRPGDDAGPRVDAGDHDAGFPPPELCEPDGRWLAVHGVATDTPHEYLGAFSSGQFGELPGNLVDEVGTRCATSADPTACEAAFETERQMSYQNTLLATDGDALTVARGEMQFASVLGTIDSPKKAALMAWQAGYNIWCSGDLTSSVTRVDGGWLVAGYQQSGGCGSPWVTTRYTIRVLDAGTVSVDGSEVVREEEDFGCIGRRPSGMRAGAPSMSTGDVGAFFANVTRLEASAVVAFDLLFDELEGLGAPAALLDEVRVARADEVRHTDAMARIARRYGAEPGTVRVEPTGPRSAYAIALENAVEGCVRETFGALVGAHQAGTAADPVIAQAMRDVADDEMRHAELSWAIAGWLEPRLTGEERAAIARAKREALAMLREEAGTEHAAALVERAGLPTPAIAVEMVDSLAATLFA